jgi:tRNA(fMet)-specific endonuclease VapC
VISTVVLSELQYGVRRSRWRKAYQMLGEFLLDFDAHGASATIFYADLRTDLEKRGQSIGPMDMMIAAHALALGASLVTHNTRELSRVQGLELEDWAGRSAHPGKTWAA